MTELIRLAVTGGVFAAAMIGWAVGGYYGAAVGVVLGVLLGVVPWRHHPAWTWLQLYLRRNRTITLAEPTTVVNDRAGGGVRYQDGVAVSVVQILGRRYSPTIFTGASAIETENILDLEDLLPAMRQALGLRVDSISVISAGARRRATGDYPRVYDTLVGPSAYAGRRETWIVLRLRAMDNGAALQSRSTIGAAALAAAQRVAMRLRCSAIRARVATATDIAELERRLGRAALEPHNRRWNSVRGEAGWQTTYAYRPEDLCTETLSQAWTLRVDGIAQNITLFSDGTASAMITVRTAQPPTAPPAVVLQALPGEQAQALAASLCGPLPRVRGLARGPIGRSLVIPVGPSGVLLGKTLNGDRLALPVSDAAEPNRVHIAADDAIAKRIIIRIAAAGDRVTVHTTNLQRWDTLRMPNIAVVEDGRPVSATTASVIDGTVPSAPRPHTVISVGIASALVYPAADVLILQTGPETVEVRAGGQTYDVSIEFFRAENLYVSRDSVTLERVLEMAD